MSNLSQEKRKEMLEYINKLKEIHKDDESIIALEKIETALTEKKYGLVWEEHEEEVDKKLVHNIPVFTEVEEKKIIADENEGFNFLLEGDNLHSLKLLEKTHKGKIDVIYIDPPYNTGSKEENFMYNDHRVEKNDGYRHSKWLSFMNERLRIAKQLLTNDGVLFISIDDNEFAQLKLLCDSIFGETNAIGPIVQNKLNSKNDTLNIQKNHEFILVYRRSQVMLNDGKTKATVIDKKVIEREVIFESGEYFYLSDPLTTRGEGGTLKARPNLGYTIYYNDRTGDFVAVNDYIVDDRTDFLNESTTYYDNKELIKLGYKPIRPPKVREELGAWTWDKNKFEAEKNKIYIKKTRNGYSVHSKRYVDSARVSKKGKKLVYFEQKESNINSVLDFSTKEGTKQLNMILGKNSFKNPKNMNMIKYLIDLKNSYNIIVLDFFAGSGTTGHAVMQLNKEDGGKRKYILCTNNENKICEEVTYKRLQNIQKELPHNLKYFKTDFTPKFTAEEDILSLRLLDHIKEMVELENMCEIDGENRVIILSDENLKQNIEAIKDGAYLYMPVYILLSNEMKNLMEKKKINLVKIPEYYFMDELREANEI